MNNALEDIKTYDLLSPPSVILGHGDNDFYGCPILWDNNIGFVYLYNSKMAH